MDPTSNPHQDPAALTGGHTAARRAVARAAFIAWRMQDVPAVYHALVPYSYEAAVLWRAEKAIRSQLAEDLALLAQPWHRVGPACNLLDYAGMSDLDMLTFGLEVSVPVGMEDRPRRPITLPPEPVEDDGSEPLDDVADDRAAKHMEARRQERQQQIDAAEKRGEADGQG